MNKHDKNRYFLAALKHRLKGLGRGGQTLVCAGAGMSSGHLSDVVKGRKPTTEESRVRIALALGSTEEEMIAEGLAIEGTLPVQPSFQMAANDATYGRIKLPEWDRRPLTKLETDHLEMALSVLRSKQVDGGGYALALRQNIKQFYKPVAAEIAALGEDGSGGIQRRPAAQK